MTYVCMFWLLFRVYSQYWQTHLVCVLCTVQDVGISIVKHKPIKHKQTLSGCHYIRLIDLFPRMSSKFQRYIYSLYVTCWVKTRHFLQILNSSYVETILFVQVVFQLNSDYCTKALQGACTVSYWIMKPGKDAISLNSQAGHSEIWERVAMDS